jgi:DNA-binding GntR family transcriptional regulator
MMKDTSEFKIRKVRKLSAEVQAADALREGILSGEIPPGTRLTEIRMAEHLAVSRATIRTAFHQLAQEGLIDQIPYTGWTVMSLSAQDAWELYTLRSSLEALGSRLVAIRIKEKGPNSPERIRLIAGFDALEAACRSGNRKDIAAADFALHRAIIDLAGHRRLSEQYEKVEQQIRIYIASSDSLVDEPGVIVDQHRPLVEALKAGDVELSVLKAVEHNEKEGMKLEAYLRTVESALA